MAGGLELGDVEAGRFGYFMLAPISHDFTSEFIPHGAQLRGR